MVDVVDVPRDWQQLGVIPAVIWRALTQPLWAMTGLQSDLRELAYNQRAGFNYKHVLMSGANMFYHCLLINAQLSLGYVIITILILRYSQSIRGYL